MQTLCAFAEANRRACSIYKKRAKSFDFALFGIYSSRQQIAKEKPVGQILYAAAV
jgi:hypothetical protein